MKTKTTDTILEVRVRNVGGLGYQRQDWPMAVHHIARLGRVESRLIVGKGSNAPGLLGAVLTVLCGLWMGVWR